MQADAIISKSKNVHIFAISFPWGKSVILEAPSLVRKATYI